MANSCILGESSKQLSRDYTVYKQSRVEIVHKIQVDYPLTRHPKLDYSEI